MFKPKIRSNKFCEIRKLYGTNFLENYQKIHFDNLIVPPPSNRNNYTSHFSQPKNCKNLEKNFSFENRRKISIKFTKLKKSK